MRLCLTQWGKWTYLRSYGANLPDFVLNALSYVDSMLRDLGIENQMKCGILKEMFRIYGPEDFGLGGDGERASEGGGANGKVYWWGWMASLCRCG